MKVDLWLFGAPWIGMAKRLGAYNYGDFKKKKKKKSCFHGGKWRVQPLQAASWHLWAAGVGIQRAVFSSGQAMGSESPFLFLPVSQSCASTIVLVEVN